MPALHTPLEICADLRAASSDISVQCSRPDATFSGSFCVWVGFLVWFRSHLPQGQYALFASATEAYLCRDDMFSWASRKMGNKGAAGMRLRRGYEQPHQVRETSRHRPYSRVSCLRQLRLRVLTKCASSVKT